MHAADPHSTPSQGKTPGGLDSFAIAAVGVIGIVILAVIVIAAEAWFYRLEDQHLENHDYTQLNAEVSAYRQQKAKQAAAIHYRTEKDKDQKDIRILAIPVDRAMDLLAEKGLEPAPSK